MPISFVLAILIGGRVLEKRQEGASRERGGEPPGGSGRARNIKAPSPTSGERIAFTAEDLKKTDAARECVLELMRLHYASLLRLKATDTRPGKLTLLNH